MVNNALLPKTNFWIIPAIGQFEQSFTIWIAGKPCSGKTTLAAKLHSLFQEKGLLSIHLDGDDLRSGLNNNLGFSPPDRTENLRRAAEVSKLLNTNKIITIASFITPLEENRTAIKEIIGTNNLLFVGLDCDLAICAQRDVKGHYAKVNTGEIKNFTGISAPFESYKTADLILDSGNLSIDQCIEAIIEAVNNKFDA
jgi:adenylylsulfate kinase